MSAHDSFLMVVPEGWTAIEVNEALAPYFASIQQAISENAFGELNNTFELLGILPPNTQVIDGRAFTDTTNHLWVQYAPDP